MNRYSDMTIWELCEERNAIETELATRHSSREPSAAPQPRHLVRRGLKPDGTSPLADDDEPAMSVPDSEDDTFSASALDETLSHGSEKLRSANAAAPDVAEMVKKLERDADLLVERPDLMRDEAVIRNEVLEEVSRITDELDAIVRRGAWQADPGLQACVIAYRYALSNVRVAEELDPGDRTGAFRND